MRGWRRVLAEARRVLRPSGALVLGRTVASADGIDARMKQRLAEILADLGTAPDNANTREAAQDWLGRAAHQSSCVVAVRWETPRSARGFLDRHRGGARFSALPDAVKDEALRRLAEWAAATFGSLDAASVEQRAFELQIYTFPPGAAHA